jgi:hypothetical protein
LFISLVNLNRGNHVQEDHRHHGNIVVLADGLHYSADRHANRCASCDCNRGTDGGSYRETRAGATSYR